MTGLKIDRLWHREGQDMQQGIVNAFQSLLADPRDWRANVDGLTFLKLEDQEAARLEKPFSKEEVFFILHELNGEKAQMGIRLLFGISIRRRSKVRRWLYSRISLFLVNL